MGGFIDFLLHLDLHVRFLISTYGTQTYLILFAIIFAETGLVVTPFLPGDTLLFAVGIFSHSESGGLNPALAFVTFCAAALCGDVLNYTIGRNLGHKLFKNERSRIFKRSNLDRTHAYFAKYGRMTVILARFVPVVRTFCPFVAGMSEMPFKIFIAFSAIAAAAWVGIFWGAGYFIGRNPFVRHNFPVVILLMVLITGAPLAFEVGKTILETRSANRAKRVQAESK